MHSTAAQGKGEIQVCIMNGGLSLLLMVGVMYAKAFTRVLMYLVMKFNDA